METRIQTGIKGMDALIGGGFPSKSVTLVSGSAGTGKTIMGLHFLYQGAQQKERCYYLSLSEKKEDLLRATNSFESFNNISNYWEKNLQVDHLEMNQDFTLSGFNELISRYPKIDRIVVDNLNKLLLRTGGDADYRVKLSQLVSLLQEKAAATMILFETPSIEPSSFPPEIFDCDGAMHLSYLDLEEKPSRVLQLVKMRYTDIDPLVRHTLVLDPKGMRVNKRKII